MATLNITPPSFKLGQSFAKEGLTYNPYLPGTRHHTQFNLGRSAYLARTHYYGEPDRTTREQ